MIDDDIKILIKVAKKIADAKVKLGVMADKHPIDYMNIRHSLNEIVDEMANYCNCSPIKLIFGDLEEIKKKMEEAKPV